MSLLFPDTLSLYIGTDRVQAVKWVGMVQRPVELRQREARVQSVDQWQDLERVVSELVVQTQTKRLRVVLSDKLIRYACFPWHAELHNAAEEVSLAKLNFDAIFGTQASDEWHFGLSFGRLGQTRLVMATPKSLFALLENNFGQKSARVESVQTAFSASARTHRAKFGKKGWLVNLEEDRLTIGSWNSDTWNWIYSAHAAITTTEELVERIRQEILLSSTSISVSTPLPIFLHMPHLEHLAIDGFAGVQFHVLKTTNLRAGPKYAFALFGGVK